MITNEHVIATVLIAFAALGSSPASPATAQRYAITDFDDLPDTGPFLVYDLVPRYPAMPQDMNDRGHVVGFWDKGLTQPRYDDAFLYDGDTMLNLGRRDGWVNSYAHGINNVGQVVGAFMNEHWGFGAFLYADGTMTELNDLLPLESEAHLRGATAINDAGQIVGFGYFEGAYRGFLLDPGPEYSLVDLGTPDGTRMSPAGINQRGQVVGCCYTKRGDPELPTIRRACLWTDGAITDLGTLGGENSQAAAINDLGQVVGYTETVDGSEHAFLWQEGAMVDLGTLPGGTESKAYDINNAGQIAGSSDDPRHVKPYRYRSAVVWENGVIVDLHTRLPDGHTWELDVATAITESGQIVGGGEVCDTERAFLLTPLPEDADAADFGDLSPGCADYTPRVWVTPEERRHGLCGLGVAVALPFMALAWGGMKTAIALSRQNVRGNPSYPCRAHDAGRPDSE